VTSRTQTDRKKGVSKNEKGALPGDKRTKALKIERKRKSARKGGRT